MKKILLLGAIFAFCDLVKEFEELNIEPYICDYYSDAPAKNMGHPTYDISTTDIEALKKVIAENGITGCVSAFSDRNLMPAIELCESIGAPYYFDKRIVECLTDKKLMKKFFCDINVPVVDYVITNRNGIEENARRLNFPVVTKPMDAYGSKGIFVCRTPDEVSAVYNETLKESIKYSDEILIEEFYAADEISITAWVKDGKAYITCFYDVFRNTENGIALSAVSFPSKYAKENYSQFNRLINYICTELKITDGPVTLQCFIGKNGIKVSELLCRLAGGSPYLYSTYTGGPNIAKMLISYCAGEEVNYANLTDYSPLPDGNEVYYDIQILVNKKGRIFHTLDGESVKNGNADVADLRVYYKNDAELTNVSESGTPVARVIYKADRDTDYGCILDKVDGLVSIYDENGNKISYVRKPEHIDVLNRYPINWDFLKEEN